MNEMLSETHLPSPRALWSPRYTGFLMVIIGSTLWGVSGTAAQQLFQSYGITPGWLVAMRMSVSGLLLLLAVAGVRGLRQTFAIWADRTDRLRLIVFAVLGLIGVQYTYFASIHLGNAATATFLQYLGPAFILLYVALRKRRFPDGRERTGLLLALVGTFLLVTNGSTHAVVVPTGAIVWGVISAVALAFYTLYPTRLIQNWGSATAIGWAMFIGGLLCAAVAQPWHTAGQYWTPKSALLVAFVILFGTLLAFYLYLASTRFITPAETSLVACCEPLSAAIAAVVWLHTSLGMATIAGGLCIVWMVLLLARRSA